MGAGRLGSSSLTERYSRPVLEVFRHPAPSSICPCKDAVIGSLVVFLLGGSDLRLDVQGQSADGAGVAIAGFGEVADRSHERSP